MIIVYTFLPKAKLSIHQPRQQIRKNMRALDIDDMVRG